MKKRHILFVLTAIITVCAFIAPALATRISNELSHRGYVVALEFNNTKKLFENDGFERELDLYKKSGVTCALIREVRHEFDEGLIKIAKNAGFDIALAVYGGKEKPRGHEETLGRIIDKYDVKYIMPKMAKGSSEYPLKLERLIDKYSLTLILSENSNQLSNEMPKGITANMESARGRIMRGYETLRKPGITVSGNSDSSELLYYQIINSARDRNTEFVFVNQIIDETDDPHDSARITQKAIKRAIKWLDSHGYSADDTPDLSSYYRKSTGAMAGGALLGVLMALAVFNMLFGTQGILVDFIFYAFSLTAFGITYLMPEELIKYYPTLFALVSSCFAYVLCMWASDRTDRRAMVSKILAVSLITLFACACVLCAMLSGTDYYLNYSMFFGVKASLLMPMVFGSMASAFMIFEIRGKSLGDLTKSARGLLNRIRPRHALILIFVIACAGIYIMRSGNAKISNGENTVRNLIAELTGARPRTKEFLIGWPALCLFAWHTKHGRSKIIRWIFASGSTLIFASVINTFCHVFTDFSTSLLRTVNGFAFSIPISVIAILIYRQSKN